MKKNTWKGHRSVVIPDYQGIGIGTRFTDYIADIFKREGKNYISTTSNPAMIHSRINNPKWVATRKGRCSSGSGSGRMPNKHIKGSTSCNRITMSFEYIGDKK